MQNLAFASLLSIAAQFGMQFWVAFWAGPTMIFNLEKPTFASIQSKLFPKFGLVGVSTSVIALAGHYFNNRGDNSGLKCGNEAILNSVWEMPHADISGLQPRIFTR